MSNVIPPLISNTPPPIQSNSIDEDLDADDQDEDDDDDFGNFASATDYYDCDG